MSLSSYSSSHQPPRMSSYHFNQILLWTNSPVYLPQSCLHGLRPGSQHRLFCFKELLHNGLKSDLNKSMQKQILERHLGDFRCSVIESVSHDRDHLFRNIKLASGSLLDTDMFHPVFSYLFWQKCVLTETLYVMYLMHCIIHPTLKCYKCHSYSTASTLDLHWPKSFRYSVQQQLHVWTPALVAIPVV